MTDTFAFRVSLRTTLAEIISIMVSWPLVMVPKMDKITLKFEIPGVLLGARKVSSYV